MVNSSFWFSYFACLSLCCSLLPPTFTLPLPFAYEQVYHKISENKPRGFYFSKALFGGLIFGGAYLQREILRFKIDWASLIVEGKLTVFAFTLYLTAISKYKPTGVAFIWRGDLTEGFFALRVWGAHIWRGLFSEFYGIHTTVFICCRLMTC